MPYKIIIDDRSYTKWSIYDSATFETLTIPNFDPIEHKLFSNDIFTFNKDTGQMTILHSSVRNGHIPGVLIVNGNKTYGREKKQNNSRLYYKCIPDDMKIPAFLIPFEIKQVGFSKNFSNLYVTFQVSKWEKEDKHPYGTLSQTIGPVDILDNFYEYQLYCKSLNNSIQKFQKETMAALQQHITHENHESLIETIKTLNPKIEDRRESRKVYTIDPPRSTDFDDAFSLHELELELELKMGKETTKTKTKTKQLSIYISNVAILMDHLQLWDSFSRRISTIYLPDKKRPMLPSILSDSLCSLQQGNSRVAFVMDIVLDDSTHEIISISYSNCLVLVRKNYVYEEPALLANPDYQKVLEICKHLSRQYNYMSNIRNSHEVVSYLMTFMNYHCALEMNKHCNGIFRSAVFKSQRLVIPDTVPEEVNKFFQIWNTSSGQYMASSSRHELLGLDAYIHITSPIRRLVDLLNMIKFQENNHLISLSTAANQFYEKWLNEMEYINITTRAIRKMQVDCALLDASANDPEMLKKQYDGYLLDKVDRNDGLYQYIVFLPDIKLSCRITLRENAHNFDCRRFTLALFHNEETFKKKIRLILV